MQRHLYPLSVRQQRAIGGLLGCQWRFRWCGGSRTLCSEMSHLWLSLVLYARDVAFISLSAISGWDASGCAFPMHSVLSSKGSQRSLVCMFHSRDNHGWRICRRLLYSCNAESSIHGPFKLIHQRHSPMKEVPHYTIIVWLKTVIWWLTFRYHTTPVCSAFSHTQKSFLLAIMRSSSCHACCHK